MELNLSFISGLGCGICIGLSIFALKKYLGFFTETAKAVKKIASDSEYKLVLVVRKDLINMGERKLAAQCVRAAAVGTYKKALKRVQKRLINWGMPAQAKNIALKTGSVDEIKEIAKNAKKMGLVTSLKRDAGKTRLARNYITVLGIGPAPKDVIDKVTGHLKLLYTRGPCTRCPDLEV